MYTPEDNFTESGSALVIALIILVIITALGLAGLEVADMNLFSAANDRDSKRAFFQADAGTNIGTVYLEQAIYDDVNASFYDHDANRWQNATSDACINDEAGTPLWATALGANPNCVSCQNTNTTLMLYSATAPMATYVRTGILDVDHLDGSAAQIGAGYEGIGKSIAKGGVSIDFLLRSKRYGERNSIAEVDSAWREIVY